MNKVMSSVITGAAVTAVAGTAAYMLSGKNTRKRKQMKKTAAKAVRTVGEIVDGITTAMR